MVILVSFLVALIGLLMYAFAANPKLAEVGRIMFGCGLLVALFNIGGQWANLFGGR
jgi:Na+/phosphate symporter